MFMNNNEFVKYYADKASLSGIESNGKLSTTLNRVKSERLYSFVVFETRTAEKVNGANERILTVVELCRLSCGSAWCI